MGAAARMLGLALLGVLATAALAVAFGPRHPVAATQTVDAAAIAADPAGYLARAEAAVPGIVPGTERRIRWAGAPGRTTPLALVYVHGFSATAREMHPMPETVADALGANLVLTRLTGHGLDGAALAAATASDWQRDLDEALAVARALGERVVILASSTGATLAATRLAEPETARDVAGAVLLSPNFALRNPAARLLDWPWAHLWGPWVAGAERGFAPVNADHARYWTERYPLRAAIPVAALIRAFRRVDPGRIAVPALFVFSDADTVIDARAIRPVAARWGGPATLHPVDPGPGIDPAAHVLAGDILSPAGTAPVAAAILDWVGGLGPGGGAG